MAAENPDESFYPIIRFVYRMLNTDYDNTLRMINRRNPDMIDKYPGNTVITIPHLKFNSMILHNFKQKSDLTLNTRLTINAFFSDHYPTYGTSNVNGEPITFKTFNLLRYGKLFNDHDMELHSPTVDVANTMAYVNQKIDSQVAICLDYLSGGDRVLALQECDFVVYLQIKNVANTLGYICWFIPRQIDIRLLTPDSVKPVNYKDEYPNPFVNTHGCAIFTKLNGQITTNVHDVSEETLEPTGHYDITDIFFHRYLNKRTAYILNHTTRVGFISVHYDKYDMTINNIVHRIFDKYDTIDELFILGDFNRSIEDVVYAYDNKCDVIACGNYYNGRVGIDHIVSITRDKFYGPPLPPPEIPPEGPMPRLPPGIVPGYPPQPTFKSAINPTFTGVRPSLKLKSKRANGQGGKPRKRRTKRITKRRRKH